MEILNPAEACFDDDFLDFTLEGEIAGEENDSKDSVSSFDSKTTTLSHEMNVCSFSDIVEEELEWLSNKDSFPSVETYFGILSDNNPHLTSTLSVLENSGAIKVPTNFPVKSRSKTPQRRRTYTSDELPAAPRRWCPRTTSKSLAIAVKGRKIPSSFLLSSPDSGRRCLHCQADRTPQWRAGPMGPKTLCNACGVRYKSGRLLPEYRPVNSPTFSSALHSNSHRRVVEMRKQKYVGGFGGEMSGGE